MAIDSDKLKATDILVESIKLIFTISTIFFGGLLTYRSSISEPISLWSCNTALFLFTLSSICSVLNINSLIGKIFRSEDDAIKKTDVKILNIISMLALLIGMALGAIFLSSQQTSVTSQKNTAVTDQTVISESQIIVGTGNKSSIKVTKDVNGRIGEVDISSKELTKPDVSTICDNSCIAIESECFDIIEPIIKHKIVKHNIKSLKKKTCNLKSK